jgi:hypothetical protein
MAPVIARTYVGRPILNGEATKRTTDFAREILSRTTTSDLPADEDDGSDKMINTLLLILGLVFAALIGVSMLFIFRRYRQQQRMRNEILPSYSDSAKHSSGPHNHHGLTIETKHNGRSSTIYISRDGAPMLANPQSPPHSPDNVPEIHITFPDEQDSEGKRKSGQVLVVRVGDNATVGLEPMQEEQLPAYEKETKNGFYSVDMDQIGGLKEKDGDLLK